MKKKIVLVGLKNKNLGDIAILDTCKFLVQNLYPDAQISIKNIFPNRQTMKEVNNLHPKIDFAIEKVKNYPYITQILNFSKWWLSQKRKTEIYKYYKKILKKNSYVIFAGGGIIKFSREYLWNPVYSITTYCQRKKIPVFFNATGVEGYDDKNFYSQLLKYSLNKPCVKKITTRDDINSLKKYVKNWNKISIAGDSALWARETYNIEDVEKTNIIGIGVIRSNIFNDYGINFSEKQLVNTYINIIKKLEEKGYKWQLFCNGAKSDYEMGKIILTTLGLPIEEKYLAPRPQKIIDLIKKIYSYKATISARLHANIIAVSYDIPTIGLVWNNKLKFFGERIECPERFLVKEQFTNANFVITVLENAILNGYNKGVINSLKSKTQKSLYEFLQTGDIDE